MVVPLALPLLRAPDPLVAGRIRTALRGALVSAVVFAAASPWLAPKGRVGLLAATFGVAVTLAAFLALLRRDGSRRTATLVGEVASDVVIVLSILAGFALDYRYTTPILPVVVAMGMGSFVPWGAAPQARLAAVAAGGVIAHSWWFGHGLGGYPMLVSLVGIALSVPMAVSVARERTRIVALAEARREADERFRSLADSSPEAFWWFDPGSGRLSFTGAAFEKISGRRLPEAYPDVRVLREAIHPDDRERLAPAFACILDRGLDEEFRIVRPDGSVRIVRTRAYVARDAATGAPRITGWSEDVTDRRAVEAALRDSERRYSDLVEHAPDPILTFDGRGRLRSANPAAHRLLGRDPSPLVGRRLAVLRALAPASRAAAIGIARGLIADGTAPPTELEIAGDDGQRILVESNQRLHHGPRSDFEVEVILRDITARRRAEEADRLRGLAAYLEAAREDERMLAARRLHDELAQPLAALRLEMSWVAQSLPRERDDLREQTRRLSEIVASVMGSARGMIADLRPTVLDDFGLAEAVRWQARELGARAGASCAVEVEASEVRCDHERAVAVFRTMQEALAAVCARRQVTRIRLELRERDAWIELVVAASGPPGEAGERTWGLSWEVVRMRERAALLGGDLEAIALGDGGEEGGAPAGVPSGVKIRMRVPVREATHPAPARPER